MNAKRRPPAQTLPLDFDWRSALKKSGGPTEPAAPDEPPAADLTAEGKALAHELGKRLVARRPAPPRPRPPSCPPCTRPGPIPAKPKRYEHLETPIETLQHMANAGDRAAQIELDAIRKAAALDQAPAIEQRAGSELTNRGEESP